MRQVGLDMQVFPFNCGTGGSSHAGVPAFYLETGICGTGGSSHAGVPTPYPETAFSGTSMCLEMQEFSLETMTV